MANSEESTDDPGSNVTQNICGVCRCPNLDQHVKEIKIKFKPNVRAAPQYTGQFAVGIGVAIRTCAELAGVSRWKGVPDENKLVCCQRLMQWFDIEDWDTKCVQDIVDDDFQIAYRHWRNTLGTCYKTLTKKGVNPRDKSPRVEVTLEKWNDVCDWLETENFKWRSITNTGNGEKFPFPQTSGKLKYISRLREMDKMLELEDTSTQEGADPVSEDQILLTALGHRSGYQKGMGYGVQVPRRTKSWTIMQQDSQINE